VPRLDERSVIVDKPHIVSVDVDSRKERSLAPLDERHDMKAEGG
jgi:hypothetical protein